MNVLMIHKFHYIEGGAERYVFNLSELLQKKNDIVIPFSMHHPKPALLFVSASYFEFMQTGDKANFPTLPVFV